ncbi:rhamnan synthesis F family protein [Amnibacterium flavum]|uniref:Lipopolysaccharide biosynthesis protein n=1 Tax=Amnibacterium flavum TaxID=2173173 RepID=A0A2V1HX68_9MICO|nr:rhamnan synthesis F family protein [Amnibacterium flavum]PVZ95869.1 hypothetical protein DDQ50_05235 [Amnibacterium flavum]
MSDLTTTPPTGPTAFPADGRRLVIYVFFDPQGVVDDFVPFALDALRAHSAHLLVVVNGTVEEAGHRVLMAHSDTVLVRENQGFDIWAEKHAIDHLGDAIAEYDEVVLTNDTWYGPVREFAPVFEKMDARALDFWGMTEHPAEAAIPGVSAALPRHLQSFWIAARRSMISSDAWRDYWRDLPPMNSYWDAVSLHELRFTEHFENAGFTSGTAFPAEPYGPGNASILLADVLIADGCPLLKRRIFHHYPAYFHRHAVIGRWTLQEVARHGVYPLRLAMSNLARTTAPEVLNADAGLLEVLPDVDTGFDRVRPPHLLAVIHAEDTESLDDALRRLGSLPIPYDLVVTTSAAVAEEAAARLARGTVPGNVEVVVADDSASATESVLDACRDLIAQQDYDLVLAVNATALSRHDPRFNSDRYRARHALDSLLGSPGHASNVLALFQAESTLGIVLPPTVGIGSPEPTQQVDFGRLGALRERLDIRVPSDGEYPLAPDAGSWIARPAALRLLLSDEELVGSGVGSHLLGSVLVPAAAQLGFHHRTVLDPRQASISHTSLEYKVDQLGSSTWGYPLDQIQMLQRVGLRGGAGLRALAKTYLSLNHPGVAGRLMGLRNRVRGGRR